jgi:hypothetical protein
VVVGATLFQHGTLGDSCRKRAIECTLVAKAAGWRGDSALKAMYLTFAHQWLDIAVIGDAADQERELERELAEAEWMLDQARNVY